MLEKEYYEVLKKDLNYNGEDYSYEMVCKAWDTLLPQEQLLLKAKLDGCRNVDIANKLHTSSADARRLVAKAYYDLLYYLRGLWQEANLKVEDYEIRYLCISTYTRNAICRRGFLTLGDVARLTYDELCSIRCIGPETAKEVIAMLSKYGLSLRT